MAAAVLVRTLGGVLAAWALWNAATVYLVFGGERRHRLETAVILLVGFAAVAELSARAARRPPIAGAFPELDARTRLALCGLALALWLASWLGAAGIPFLSDDYVLLARYREGAAQSPQQFFRPVFGALFRALSWAGGESIWPFRIAAAALHVGSAILVSRLAARLAGSAAAGAIGFVVFLLNPLQAEAVVWIAGLQETLWTFLALSALAVHARDDWPALPRLAAVVTLAALAFGAKETAACLVLLLPALDLARRRTLGATALGTYALVGVAFAAYLALRARFVALEADALAPPTRYVLKQFLVLPYQRYLQPWSTAAIAMPALVSFATAALGILALAWMLIGRRHWRAPATGAFVILASTLPLGAYFFVRDDLAGARYLYAGAFGWSLLVWSALAAGAPSPRTLAGAAAAIAVSAAALLHVNLRPWRQAAEIVRAMEAAAAQGGNPVAAADEGARRLGVALVSRDGIPREVGGVGLFVNGYPEFLARIGPGRSSTRP